MPDPSEADAPVPADPGPSSPGALSKPIRWLLTVLGTICVVIGGIAIVVPLVPTTPFLLLAAFLYARGSKRFHDWLLHHPRLGPYVVAWHETHTVPLRAKVLGIATVWTSVLLTGFFVRPPWWAYIGLAVVGAGVTAFLLLLKTGPVARPRGAAATTEP